MTNNLPPTWRPLIQEAGIAAESLASGLGTLRKANYAQQRLYYHAFFGLSIGLERLMKLIVLIAHVIETGGQFPDSNWLKHKYGHNLLRLFSGVKSIRSGFAPGTFRWELEDEDVANAILLVLSDFATATRYYNLDLLVGATKANQRDAIKQWAEEVGELILESKYDSSQAAKDEHFSAASATLLDPYSLVLHNSEDGNPISDVAAATLAGRRGEFVQREATFCAARLVRFIYEVLFELAIPSTKSRPGLHSALVGVLLDLLQRQRVPTFPKNLRGLALIRRPSDCDPAAVARSAAAPPSQSPSHSASFATIQHGLTGAGGRRWVSATNGHRQHRADLESVLVSRG